MEPAVVEPAHPAAEPAAAPVDVAGAVQSVQADTGEEDGLVEVLDDGDGSAAAAPSFATPVPVSSRFVLTGWARESLELYPHDFDAVQVDAASLPRDQFMSRTQLLMAARYAEGRDFEAVVSGLLAYNLYESLPRAGEKPNGLNGDHVRGSLAPQLRELYLGWFWSRLDLRIGQQRVAWGVADALSPNDVLNARDGSDPFLGETELRRVGAPMVRADLELDIAGLPAHLQLVYQPFFIPDRGDAYGTNWAALQRAAPASLRGFLNLGLSGIDLTLRDAVQPLVQQTRLPRYDLTNPSFGARLSWTAGGVDVSHYYHYGYDSSPVLAVHPGFMAALGGLDPATATPDQYNQAMAAAQGAPLFTAAYIRRHHLGMDAVTMIGAFALRLEAAYENRRVFFSRDFATLALPSFQGVASIEYQTGDVEKLVLVELLYQRVIDDPHTELLFYDRDSFGLAVALRTDVWRKLGVETRSLLGLKPLMYLCMAQINWKSDPMTLSVGALLLGGERFSFAQYYEQNMAAFARLKYSY